MRHRYQCSFAARPTFFLLRLSEQKRDLLKIAAAKRQTSMNRLLNELIDGVIQKEKAASLRTS